MEKYFGYILDMNIIVFKMIFKNNYCLVIKSMVDKVID